MKIKSTIIREILDSRGNPTLEVEMTTEKEVTSRAAVPSGASTGAFEALELRDGDKNRFVGKGVLKAKENAALLAKKATGTEFNGFKAFDEWLLNEDGTKNKSKYGANALLGLSMAFSKAEALEKNIPYFKLFRPEGPYKLPVPLMNVLNGGAHADNGLDIQEFMIVPKCGETYLDAVRAGAEVFQNLKKILSDKSLSTSVGDEGGFAPVLKNNEEAITLLMTAIEKSGYKPGVDMFLALDVAATEFCENGVYSFEGKKISSEELTSVYSSWVKKYPFMSIEDGFDEEDWDGWVHATKEMGDTVQLVGDDLFVTNVERISKGLEIGAANALLVKANQIGTISETLKAVNMMHENGKRSVMSHRSGETEDVIISHLSVGMNCSQIKTGSLCRGERTAKYNELLRISEVIDPNSWIESVKNF